MLMNVTLRNPDLIKGANLIGGRWIGQDEGAIPVTDPATGVVLGTVPNHGAAETRAAIEAAQAAFPAWRAKTAAERADALRRLHASILENHEDLAKLLTSEQGKPLGEAKAEVSMSAAYILWFAEEARRAYGDVIPSPWPNRRILVTKEPVGVVGAITPWNFPSSMIARKLGPALAAGCTIVLKPATQTPFSGLAWGVLCQAAGIPDGVVNILTGSAKAIGGELTGNPLVKKITFTGSTPVGKLLMEQAAKTVKKVSMELGGNAPFIVFDDADLDRAVEGAMAAKYRNTGQTCVCTNRFLVQDGIHDAFAERLAAASKGLKVGNGLEDGVQQGPLIDENAVRRSRSMSRTRWRRAPGDRRRPPSRARRHLLRADGAHRRHPRHGGRAGGDFGPLSPLFRFEDEAEAVRLANDTEYGLACYFYTQSLGRAFRVSEALEYGLVGVNEGIITTEVAPFGGVKESGVGREGSRYGIEDYLSVKYTCMGGLGA
jgi:succinate-semialdehyde dehydrogenase/glutarate-semialdehyde dehydrogenase